MRHYKTDIALHLYFVLYDPFGLSYKFWTMAEAVESYEALEGLS